MLGQGPLLSQSTSKLMAINNATLCQDIFTFSQQRVMDGDYTLGTTLGVSVLVPDMERIVSECDQEEVRNCWKAIVTSPPASAFVWHVT